MISSSRSPPKSCRCGAINYDRLIAVASADKTARLEANATASLTLYCDAKANNDRFAICDKCGNPIWHGRFFATDHDYNGEQSAGENRRSQEGGMARPSKPNLCAGLGFRQGQAV